MITKNTIKVDKEISNFYNSQAGAIVSFIGTVRDVNNNKQVDYLEYESFEKLANKVIQEILDTAKTKWKLINALCIHRVGALQITDVAVLVLTSSAHRDEAYAANKYIIDSVKHLAPIWKKEIYLDGTYEWGNNCNCSDPSHMAIHKH